MREQAVTAASERVACGLDHRKVSEHERDMGSKACMAVERSPASRGALMIVRVFDHRKVVEESRNHRGLGLKGKASEKMHRTATPQRSEKNEIRAATPHARVTAR